MWGQQAENLNKYCKKGSQVAIEGRLHTGSFESQDGTKKYFTEVVVRRAEFLGSKSKEENNLEGMSNTQIVNKAMNDDSDPFKDFGREVELTDDDLPF